MATDWTVKAREIVEPHDGCLGLARCSPYCQSKRSERVAALAAEAFAAGEQKHVEHHKCERCFAAGHAAGVAEERKQWEATHKEGCCLHAICRASQE